MSPERCWRRRAIELLEVSPDLIPPALERLAQDDRIRPDMIPLDHQEDQERSSRQSVEAAGSVRLTGDLPDPALLWRERAWPNA